MITHICCHYMIIYVQLIYDYTCMTQLCDRILVTKSRYMYSYLTRYVYTAWISTSLGLMVMTMCLQCIIAMTLLITVISYEVFVTCDRWSGPPKCSHDRGENYMEGRRDTHVSHCLWHPNGNPQERDSTFLVCARCS